MSDLTILNDGEILGGEKKRIPITEDDKVHEKWYVEAKSVNLETLPEFLRKLTDDYTHDYGTICHAMTAGAIATLWAMNESPQGGISGFQAGAIFWEFYRNWLNHGQFHPTSMVDYTNMLYPDYEHHFERTITKGTWAWLQEKAQEKLNDSAGDEFMPSKTVDHWKSIVAGNVPFGYTVEDDDE